jgi:hypothetical protein
MCEFASFHGVLTTDLGDAGFASQETANTSRIWNLTNTAGVVINILEADGVYFPNRN